MGTHLALLPTKLCLFLAYEQNRCNLKDALTIGISAASWIIDIGFNVLVIDLSWGDQFTLCQPQI
jgi:hypothetical protein